MSGLGDFICTNTKAREWTAEDWRACLERAKHHPGFEPPPYVVVSPADFVRMFERGEIDADGNRLEPPGSRYPGVDEDPRP